MNIERFKQQHVDILAAIAELRAFTRMGIADHAADIAKLVVAMSSTVKLHLAVEDSHLYPALQSGNNRALAMMGKRFQDEMTSIAEGYVAFSRKWNNAASLVKDPEGFRADANLVLKVLYDRMQKENTDFYPAVEAG